MPVLSDIVIHKTSRFYRSSLTKLPVAMIIMKYRLNEFPGMENYARFKIRRKKLLRSIEFHLRKGKSLVFKRPLSFCEDLEFTVSER